MSWEAQEEEKRINEALCLQTMVVTIKVCFHTRNVTVMSKQLIIANKKNQ